MSVNGALKDILKRERTFSKRERTFSKKLLFFSFF